MHDPSLTASMLVVLAFVFRSGALVCLLLLWRFFARAQGPLVQAFQIVFATFSFLLAWVWLASVAELVGYISEASALVEHGTNFIFIPNAVVFGALLWLLLRLHYHRHERP